MIYAGIAALLRADQQLSAVVGDRVYFLDAEQLGDYPDIIQYPSSGAPAETIEGAAPPWTRRISIECRGTTYAEAHRVGEHVLRILNNRVGLADDENIQACRVVSDVPLADDTSSIKRRVLDFRITHSPA
ncbi:hypothetical protein Mpop_2680 [Methylorubrum populi BJ001]|jgi:hypothetical protein|uniref:DUF3168 domain-containing protein n=1 Tax=Methylorubrum populi (strain ATCC BAA-705 / NCIMB 13946 / BJ001) TaxID=441620 RepID=B1ZCW6_METPB|nr:DUF3168 domain-containing protein [Methylorubrum populi]ACB80835.1 hypothetical protein Mpop_2680 [Methylorubrum populi BJ001]